MRNRLVAENCSSVKFKGVLKCKEKRDLLYKQESVMNEIFMIRIIKHTRTDVSLMCFRKSAGVEFYSLQCLVFRERQHRCCKYRHRTRLKA